MAEPTLEGCREKWARGMALAENLIEKVEEYEDADTPPYRLSGTWMPERKQYVFTGEIIREMGHAAMWGVILGEIVHNWRSSLDHLLWQLVLLDTGKDGTTEHQFPIASSGGQYWSKTKDGEKLRDSLRERRLKGLTATHKTEIDRLQPYRTNEPGKLESLEALREMSNHDKHRLLHTILLAVDVRPKDGFHFVTNPDAGDWHHSHTNPFDPAAPAEVLVADFTCPGPNPNVECPNEPSIAVGIDPLSMRLSDLPEIGRAVLTVIDTFADSFPGV